MVVLSKGELEQIALPAVQRAAPPLAAVPEVSLAGVGGGAGNNARRAAAARAVARACEEHGFFRVTGHGVAAGLLARVDAAAAAFFALPQREKEKAAAAVAPGGGPFGYASKGIGGNGDLGWVEYLLLGVAGAGAAPLPVPAEASLCSFRDLLHEYAAAVRAMTCTVLELVGEGLGLAGGERDAFARLARDADSDSMLRVNHYPARHGGGGGARLMGFGEHTDPQLVSVLRSSGAPGLEVSLRDGTWASVPSASASGAGSGSSFFVNVGDALQALTNGRLRSVRHRVVVGGARPRVSVIFFAGPPPRERLAPPPGLVDREGGRRRYREFTWTEYKACAYRTRLADDRLGYFETTTAATS